MGPGGAAEHSDPRPLQGVVLGVQPCPDGRVDSVRTDEYVGRQVACRGVREHPSRGLVEAGQPVVGTHRVGTEPLAHRRQQEVVQPSAVYRQLRVAVPALEPPRFPK